MKDELRVLLDFILFYSTLRLVHNQEITYENQSCPCNTHE